MNIHTPYGDYLYLGSHMKCPKHGWVEIKKLGVCPRCEVEREVVNEKKRNDRVVHQ